MIFKHKLSCRLAMIRDAVLVGILALISCKIPSRASLQDQPSKLIISPSSVVVPENQTADLYAVALDATGDTTNAPITWTATAGSITDTSMGAVHRGRYRAPGAPGQYKVKAHANGGSLQDSATVTVSTVSVASLGLSPSSAGIIVGRTQQFTAVPMDSAGNPLSGRAITWVSSTPAAATVSGSGLAAGVSAGSTTITGTSEGQSATATLTVSTVPVASVTVTPSSATITVGTSTQLSAVTKDSAGGTLSGRVVTWATSNAAVATVNTSGLLTSSAVGSATITATSEGKSGTATVTVTNVPVASVTVSPATASIPTGSTQQLSAVTKDSAGNTLTGRVVIWSSSNSAVASVNSSGLVTGVAAGSATITATSESKSGTAAITVIIVPVASVTVSPASASIGIGGTRQLSAVTKDAAGNTLTGRAVTWASSNLAVATVAGTGLVTGVTVGSVTITATSEGKSGTATISVIIVPVASVTVSPAAASIAISGTRQLSAVTKDSAGNTLTGRVVTWGGSNTAVATVDATGLVTGVIAGSATITATSEGKSGTASINVTSGTGAPDPTLPVLLNTQYSAPTGATITVPAGGDFQAALNNAQPGDQILLAAGATYTGPFTLPMKAGNSWILIRSSTADANLPAEGQRMKPSYAAVLPKIVSADVGPAIQTAPGAHHYRFLGVEITTTATSLNYGLVLFGDGGGAQNSLAQVPHDLILDRTYIHGNATVNLSRCVALNSAASAVIDSYLSECHAKGQDAQAIAGWNGPGPFKIVNNYLEGSGENVMFGGSDPSIPNLIPSDIEIRRNYFFKPLAWYPAVWSIKNLLELKLGRRILIQGNIFENSWAESQTGFAMLIWSVNQSGTTSWAQTADVWIRENIIRHAASGVMITDFNTDHPEYPTLYTQRVRFDNNLWEDISTSWGGDGRLIQVASGSGQLTAIKFYHQTGFAERTLITIASGVTQQFEFANIIVDHGLYGIHADDASEQGALDLHMPGYLFAGNAVIGGAAASYPTGNFFPATVNNVGFVNAAGGDYHLTASSPYKNQGTDGTDLGADITAILNWTNGVDQ